jgi:hypothetical protein
MFFLKAGSALYQIAVEVCNHKFLPICKQFKKQLSKNGLYYKPEVGNY